MRRAPITMQTMLSTRAPGFSHAFGRALMAAGGLAALGASPAAHAADPPAPAAAEAAGKTPAEAPSTAVKSSADPKADVVERAEALFREGGRLVGQQRWAEAEGKFISAFALNPTYDVANNLGQTQFRIGKHRDAAKHLAYAVLHWPLIGKKDARDLAVKRLDEVKKQVGTLNVSTSAPGADVSLDGATIARSPLDLPLFVDPGPHALVAKLAGFDDARVEVNIGRGQTQDVSLPLVKLASSLSQGSGSTSASGSSSVGPLQGSGNKDAPTSVGPNKAVLVAGGATAGAALVAGVVFTVLANGKAAEANARLQLLEPSGPRACVSAAAECRQIDSDWRARDAFSNVALFSFIGAGVLAAGTIVYGLTSPRRPTKGEHARFEALPIVVRTGSGIVIRGAW
jgi:PEGA domain